MRIACRNDEKTKWVEIGFDEGDRPIEVIQLPRSGRFGAFMEDGDSYAIGKGVDAYEALIALDDDVDARRRT